MYSYPLRFKFDPEKPEKDLSILDSKKSEVLFRPRPGGQMLEGKKPVVIFSAKDRSQAVYQYQIQNKDKKTEIFTTTPMELKLGSLKEISAREWELFDAQGLPFGAIKERCAYKSSFWEILWSASIIEDLIKIFFPHRYEVSMRDKKVLVLRESDSTLVDDYFLKKKGEFNDREESLLVAGLISILATESEEDD